MSSELLLFVGYRLDDLDVHRIVADPSDFRRDTRPMHECLRVAGKSGARGQALRVVIGRRWVALKKEAGILPAHLLQLAPSSPPLRNHGKHARHQDRISICAYHDPSHRRRNSVEGVRLSMSITLKTPGIALLAVVLVLASAAAADETRIIGEARVIDGDTLDVGPVRIRLHGIDAPEAGQRCGTAAGGSWPCGDRATARLAGLVQGKEIECIARDRDAYGRIIAVCYAAGEEVNALLVREGLAWAFLRYSDDYEPVEAEAKAERIGVWQGEAETPWDYRANRWERAAAASPKPGCPIKGNINREGEKIYHTPWSPWYERTQIDESKGQRWFCDEAEAEAAGWRPARWR